MPSTSPISDFQNSAGQALTALGAVPYPMRRSLCDGVKTLEGSSFAHAFAGRLAIACARRSHGLWQAGGGWPELDAFEDVALAGLGAASAPVGAATDWLSRAEREVMQRYYDGSAEFQNGAGLAGLSCVRCVETSLGRFSFDPVESCEIEVEPGGWDSAFLSACAVAGGAPWQRDGGTATDEAARSRFWRWYHEEAVPMAYAEAAQ